MEKPELDTFDSIFKRKKSDEIILTLEKEYKRTCEFKEYQYKPSHTLTNLIKEELKKVFIEIPQEIEIPFIRVIGKRTYKGTE